MREWKKLREELLTLTHELEDLFDNHAGWKNLKAIEEVKRAAFRFRTSELQPSGPIREKIGSIEGWAELAFSVRKFERYGPDGLRQVQHFARSDLMTLRGIIRSAERASDARR